MPKYVKVAVPDDFDPSNHKLIVHTKDSLTDTSDECTIWQPTYRNVLDKGFIGLVDYMGDDQTVVDAARMSYGRGTRRVNEDRNLIRYLIRNRHWTPVEMVEIMWHVKAPIFVFRQWHRHRTASINEYSARYSVLSDDMYVPNVAVMKPQSQSNKQGRDGTLSEDNSYACQLQIHHAYQEAVQAYQYLLGATEVPSLSLQRRRELVENFGMQMIKRLQETDPAWSPDLITDEMIDARMKESEYASGIAFTDAEFREQGLSRELARIVMPLGSYSEMYWKSNLRNTMNFLSLRCDPHAQEEIRVYADIMLEMLEPIAPICVAAFIDYQLQGRSISRMELDVVRNLYSAAAKTDPYGYSAINRTIEDAMKDGGASSREIREFIDMINKPPATEPIDAENKD